MRFRQPEPAPRPQLVPSDPQPSFPPEDETGAQMWQVRELQERLATTEKRSQQIEEQLRSADELLDHALDERRAARHESIAAGHYRSLLQTLRSRWYLRPFVRRRAFRPPSEDAVDCWLHRGPRFDPPPVSFDSQRRRRVLVVGHLLGKRLFGSEQSLVEMIAAINPDKFDVFAIFPRRNDQVFNILLPQVQGIGVVEYCWWRKGRPFHEETVAFFLEICRRLAIDLVHVNTVTVSEPLIAARRAGIPGITNARELVSCDPELCARLGGSPEEITRIVCENSTYLLANSAATLADYPCATRGGFLYNSISAEAFDLANHLQAGRIRVGLVSSNIPKKGVLDFVELARRAETSLPELEFVLVGPDTPLIRGLKSGPDTPPRNLHFHDYVSHPPDAYRDLNIVLNLSRFAESFGRTVAEAMMARRPVIAYRHGALPELIDDGATGFLVPYLDLAQVLARLRFFAEEPARITEFGERARERSMQRFPRAALSEGINALYKRLIRETQPTR